MDSLCEFRYAELGQLLQGISLKPRQDDSEEGLLFRLYPALYAPLD
jgi:hypothetical protein